MERFDEREIKAVEQLIRSGKLSQFFKDFRGGKHVQAFEQEFAKYIGIKHAISICNGTVSLEIALKALGVGDGDEDEVITTPLSFIATATAILRCGATPVFVDIEPTTLNINPRLIEDALTENTAAIIPVSLCGMPVDMDRIKFHSHNAVPILHDAAQALGAEYNRKKVGSQADLASFSFQETKTITSLDYNEPIILQSPDRRILVINIGDFIDNCNYREWKALSFDTNLRLHFVPITGVYKHPVSEQLYELTLENGRKCIVSASHSVIIIDNASIIAKPVDQLNLGDFCCVPLRVPNESPVIAEINFLKEFLKLPVKLIKNLYFRGQKIPEAKSCWKTKKPSYKLTDLIDLHVIVDDNAEIGNKSFKIPAKIKITPQLCKLIGYFLAEGNWSGKEAVLTFGSSLQEKLLAQDAKRCIEKCFKNKARIYHEPTKTTVHFGHHYLKIIFKEIFKTGTKADCKTIPTFLFQVSDENKKAFIKGLYQGDGHLQIRKEGSKANYFVNTVSKHIAKELPYLLLSLGLLPTIEYRKETKRHFPNYTSKCKANFCIGVRGIKQVNYIMENKVKAFSSKPQLVECIPANHAGLRHLGLTNDYNARKFGYRTIFEKERVTRNTLKKIPSKYLQSSWIQKLLSSDIGFAKIKKIRKVKPSASYVYDLCIEGYENFVGGFGGICFHNTLGEGGMIVTNSDILADQCRHIRNHGNIYGEYSLDIPCTNARMTEAQAAFGRIQLQKLDYLNEIQIRNANHFLDELQQFNTLLAPISLRIPGYFIPTYYLIPTLLNPAISRDLFLKKLQEKQISQGIPGQNVGYYKHLIYEVPIFQQYKTHCPNAYWVRDNLLLWDIHRFNHTIKDIDNYVKIIKDILGEITNES